MSRTLLPHTQAHIASIKSGILRRLVGITDCIGLAEDWVSHKTATPKNDAPLLKPSYHEDQDRFAAVYATPLSCLGCIRSGFNDARYRERGIRVSPHRPERRI